MHIFNIYICGHYLLQFDRANFQTNIICANLKILIEMKSIDKKAYTTLKRETVRERRKHL